MYYEIFFRCQIDERNPLGNCTIKIFIAFQTNPAEGISIVSHHDKAKKNSYNLRYELGEIIFKYEIDNLSVVSNFLSNREILPFIIHYFSTE